MHLPSYTPVESGRIDNNGEIGPAFVGFGNQLEKEAPDLWQMTEYLQDSNHGELSGVDNGLAAGSTHAISASTEKLQRRIVPAQGLHEQRAVHFAGGLPSGDENSHRGHCKGGNRSGDDLPAIAEPSRRRRP